MDFFNKLIKRNKTEEDISEVAADTALPQVDSDIAAEPETKTETEARPRSEEVHSVHDYFETPSYDDQPVVYETEEEPYSHVDKNERKMALLEPWNIVWSWVVMSIPVLGWIFAILWALGLCRTRQKKFLARAFIIISLLTLVLYAIAYAFYTLVFRLELNDLPVVLASIYNWLWNVLASLFNK